MRSWLSNKAFENPFFAPVLLIAVTLAVYYPAMLSGIHTIDDPGIISLYSASPPLSKILLPGNGYYYRPLVELSFWLDNRLWGMAPSVMHLENILLHMGNVLLVLLLARRISGYSKGANPLIPLFAALLFALHPLNVEAVGWIAGRTEPLLAFFILSACYFLLSWLDEPRWQQAVFAVSLGICGVLTKETALAFLPVAVLLILRWPVSPGSISGRKRLVVTVVIALSAVLLVVSALILRGSASAVDQFVLHRQAGVMQSAQDAIIAFGFYLKKIIAPLPLNFAITEVSPVYGLFGGVALAVLCVLLKRRQPAPLFFAAAALMATPALVVAVQHIAWTPFAERYMYLPTAFLALAICSVLSTFPQKVLSGVAPILLLLVVAAAVFSLHRTMLWQDKLSFQQDTVAKSPGFGSVYNELGTLYLQRNEFDKAAVAFATAERLNKRPSMTMVIKANVMATMVAKGDYAAARSYFLQLFKDKNEASVDFLELLQKADGKRFDSLSLGEKVMLSRDLTETFALLYAKTKEPFWLYRSGKLARAQKSYPQAYALFRKAYAEAPTDAHYRAAAQTQMQNLEYLK